MPRPYFSVIMPVFNANSVLRDTLRSIETQTFRDFEVIAIDDGSTDNSLQILSNHPWIQVIRQTNRGPGPARNAGITASRGKYLTFLDSDDLWFPWTLSTFADAIRATHAKFLCGDAVEFSSTPPSEIHTATETCVFKNYLDAGSQGLWVGTCGAVIHRETLIKAGGFHTSNLNAEDSDLWLRLGTAQPFTHITKPKVFAYRRRKDTASGNLNKSVDGILQLLESESHGVYPGKHDLRQARCRIIGAHVRPVIIQCLKQKQLSTAYKLYSRSLKLHLRTARWRFLLGVPVLAFFAFLGITKQ